MKIVKTASGKKKIKMSKKEWKSMGRKAGWIKKAQVLLEYGDEIEEYIRYKGGDIASKNMDEFTITNRIGKEEAMKEAMEGRGLTFEEAKKIVDEHYA